MTAGEACELAVQLTRQLSGSRAESESWRLLALAAMQYASELSRELEMVDQRNYIHRTRAEERRDVFSDQRDLREAA